MNSPPILLILPGATANRGKLQRCVRRLAEAWPEATVRVADFRSRCRDTVANGLRLDHWVERALPPAAPVFVLSYILGAAALPYAPGLVRRARGIVVVRSRYQEAVVRWLRSRLTRWGTALLLGRAVADLGEPPFWPAGFQLACPHLILLETGRSRAAVRLRVAPLSDAEMGISGYKEVAIDHDAAYDSALLIELVTHWLHPLNV